MRCSRERRTGRCGSSSASASWCSRRAARATGSRRANCSRTCTTSSRTKSWRNSTTSCASTSSSNTTPVPRRSSSRAPCRRRFDTRSRRSDARSRRARPLKTWSSSRSADRHTGHFAASIFGGAFATSFRTAEIRIHHFLGRLVDFSFGDPEVVVQPSVPRVVRLEPYRGDDRAVDGRRLLNDAVSFDGDEDLRAVGGGNRPVQVRTPDEIFAAPRMIRPVHRSADPRTDDVALPGPEPGVLGLAVRGQPRPLAILHSQRAKFLEPHRAPPSGDIEGRLFGRSGRGLLRHLRSRANHSPAGGFGGLSSRTEALRLRRLQSSARTTAERIPRTPMLGAPRYGPVMLKGFVSTWSEAVFVTE